MRIRLKLKVTNSKYFPYDYNYYLVSIIYSLIGTSSEEFAAKLHNEGYQINGKTYKLFNFALRFEKAVPDKDQFKLFSPRAELFISSPLTEAFMSNLISGILKLHNSHLTISNLNVCFKIEKLEILEDLHFNTVTNFRLLSPIVLSTRKMVNGSFSTYYLRYYDNEKEINRILTSNLRNKYKIIHNKSSDGNIELSWDKNYIKKRLIEKKHLSSKIIIGKNRLVADKIQEGISVIGINIPFNLKGDPELIKTGYECGFGEKNSMGFGMAEVV